MLMEFPGGQTAWFTLVNGIMVLENGRPVNPNRIQVGDWAQILINRAVIAPGVMMESVREVALDGGGHHISTIVMGRTAGFNAAQNQLSVQHAQELTPLGWSNHRPLAQFNIGGANVQYFFDGRPVNQAFFNRYLGRADATVYLALENNFAGQRVHTVSVRTGRDELLRPDEVLSAGNNVFTLLEIPGQIHTDPGSIVVRNGRLVDPNQVSAADWARVSLSGNNTAAVVDISQPPATSGVQIVRGRVVQVWPHNSFRVEPISIFDGMSWNYSPINREFTIDHDTLFFGPDGLTSIDDFIGFTDISVIDDVFNVVVDGGRAARVIDAPFTQPIPSLPTGQGHLTMRGTIFSIEGTTVNLRGVQVLDGRTGQWSLISNTNATAVVSVQPNTIIIDRNQVVGAGSLQAGQQLLVLTPHDRADVTIAPGITGEGYIILVEN